MKPDYYVKSGLNKTFTKITVFLREFFTPNIIVNACLYFDWGKIMPRNWGDDINFHLLKTITQKNIIPYDCSSLANRLHKKCYMCIGSTITFNHIDETIVWGAGVIDPNSELKHKPLKVLAVRGPLSRKYLIDNNIECPEVYGDPALLLPHVYKPIGEKRFKLGIIPHYDDFDNPILDYLKKDPSILFIKMEGYSNWTDVIDQIYSCEYIASSSLHGLIVAEAYKIPNLWVEISGQLLGGHFKFHDFFLSIGKNINYPYTIDEHATFDKIIYNAAKWHPGKIDLQPLINAAPFKIHIN